METLYPVKLVTIFFHVQYKTICLSKMVRRKIEGCLIRGCKPTPQGFYKGAHPWWRMHLFPLLCAGFFLPVSSLSAPGGWLASWPVAHPSPSGVEGGRSTHPVATSPVPAKSIALSPGNAHASPPKKGGPSVGERLCRPNLGSFVPNGSLP